MKMTLHTQLEERIQAGEVAYSFGGAQIHWLYVDSFGAPDAATLPRECTLTNFHTPDGIYLNGTHIAHVMSEDLYNVDSVVSVTGSFFDIENRLGSIKGWVPDRTVIGMLQTEKVSREIFSDNPAKVKTVMVDFKFENFSMFQCNSKLEVVCKVIDSKCTVVSELVFIPQKDLELLIASNRTRIANDLGTGILCEVPSGRINKISHTFTGFQ